MANNLVHTGGRRVQEPRPRGFGDLRVRRRLHGTGGRHEARRHRHEIPLAQTPRRQSSAPHCGDARPACSTRSAWRTSACTGSSTKSSRSCGALRRPSSSTSLPARSTNTVPCWTSWRLKRGVDGYEINVSCPNVKEGGLSFGTSCPMTARDHPQTARPHTQPLIIKLTPNVTHISEFARAVEDEGADAVSVINTLIGMAINVRTRKPMSVDSNGRSLGSGHQARRPGKGVRNRPGGEDPRDRYRRDHECHDAIEFFLPVRPPSRWARRILSIRRPAIPRMAAGMRSSTANPARRWRTVWGAASVAVNRASRRLGAGQLARDAATVMNARTLSTSLRPAVPRHEVRPPEHPRALSLPRAIPNALFHLSTSPARTAKDPPPLSWRPSFRRRDTGRGSTHLLISSGSPNVFASTAARCPDAELVAVRRCSGRPSRRPQATFFEATTCIAFLYFADEEWISP